jgi:sulfur-carrier protein
MGPAESVSVSFAPALQRHVSCPAQACGPGTLAEVLNQAFGAAPSMRGYVLDDQGNIRKHVAVFINGSLHTRRNELVLRLTGGDQVHVIQCLTGG